jgi:hypothetical protein
LAASRCNVDVRSGRSRFGRDDVEPELLTEQGADRFQEVLAPLLAEPSADEQDPHRTPLVPVPGA